MAARLVKTSRNNYQVRHHKANTALSIAEYIWGSSDMHFETFLNSSFKTRSRACPPSPAWTSSFEMEASYIAPFLSESQIRVAGRPDILLYWNKLSTDSYTAVKDDFYFGYDNISFITFSEISI